MGMVHDSRIERREHIEKDKLDVLNLHLIIRMLYSVCAIMWKKYAILGSHTVRLEKQLLTI